MIPVTPPISPTCFAQHRRRGAQLLRGSIRVRCRPRSPWSAHGTPSTATTPPTWRCRSPEVGANPRELAGWLAEALIAADGIDSAEVAGPGFVNLRITTSARGAIVTDVVAAGARYGHSDLLGGRSINLEFVSANPTGPIHIGGTRWAAVGDALGRLLSTQGAQVVREYYFNDHGAQIDRFVNSLIAAAKGEPAPEDGYAGLTSPTSPRRCWPAPDALSLPGRAAARNLPEIGVELMFDHIKKSPARVRHRLRRLHPRRFDAHHRTGGPGHRTPAPTGRSTRRTAQPGCAPPTSATTRTVSSSRATASPPTSPATSPTTWTSASAGFDLCIYMLGADHHGYIARLKAAAAAPATIPTPSRC